MKCFIDGGANLGQAYDFFSQKYPDRDFFLYEINSNCFETLRNKCDGLENVKVFNKGLYSEQKTLDVYSVNPEQYQQSNQGVSLIEKHNSNHYNAQTVDTVECVDIHSLITELNERYDDIVLKLDIEGSEYPVLKRLLEHPNLSKISEIYVEWHAQYSDELEDFLGLRKQDLLDGLLEKNIKHHEWH